MVKTCIFEPTVFKAEAKGWRAGIHKVCKRPDLRPVVHSVWFPTEAEARKYYRSLKRKC